MRNYQLWATSEIDLLRQYYPETNWNMLFQFLPGRTKNAIHSKAEQLGIKPISLWTDDEVNLLTKIYSDTTWDRRCKTFPYRTKEAIKNKATELNLKSSGKARFIPKKHSKDEDYFSIPNLENSYWAGFIAADGCCYTKSNALMVKLSKKDTNHLEKFSKCIQYTGNLNFGTSLTRGKICYSAGLQIYSASKILLDLKNNFNVVDRKTFTLESPINLSEENQLAFIKGYIDGDGYIYLDKKQKTLEVGVAGTKQFLIWIKETVDKLIPTNKILAQVRKVENIHKYKIAGKRAIKFLNILHKMPTPELKRKWNKLEEYK